MFGHHHQQVGKLFLSIDLIVRKEDDTNFADVDAFRLVNIVFTSFYREDKHKQLEHLILKQASKRVGRVSTTMR